MDEQGDVKAGERRAFVASEQSRLISCVCDSVRLVTRARGCVIGLGSDGRSGGELFSPVSGPGQPLLEAFCAMLMTRPEEAGERLCDDVPVYCREQEAEGQALQFFGMVLRDAENVPLGALSLSHDAAQWQPEPDLGRCVGIGRMAELLIDTYAAKLELEIDLLASNRRAARLQRISQTDPLTLLENSASFEDKALDRLQRGVPEAVVLIDIDHFKAINDLYGHQFGDNYLKIIAQAVSSAFPDTALIGRLGGDEYGVLVELPRSGRGYLDSLLLRCRTAVQRATATLGKPELGRISIGASLFPDQAQDFATLFDMADSALYVSKKSGRSGITVFDRERHARFNSRELRTRFLRAVANRDLVPFYQPIVDLGDGTPRSYEVLARWREPDRALLIPAEFDAVLQDHRLAGALTRRMMEQALEDQARMLPAPGPALALNLTFFDLMDPEFVFDLQSALSDIGAGWSSVTIEVTEKVMMGERNGQIFQSLTELRARGARVALDDFGTGYAGLGHVADWPIDLLKIDKKFTGELGTGSRRLAIIEAMLGIADKLGIEVVAEGIETPLQLDLLRSMGCTLGQGYLFSRPVPAEALIEMPSRYDLDTLSGRSAG